jgi:hypothetical protein
VDREDDVEAGAAVGGVVDGRRAALGVGGRSENGEPEPEPGAARLAPARLAPAEAIRPA